LKNQCVDLKSKIFEARSEIELQRMAIETEFQDKLRRVESDHHLEIKKWRSKVQAVKIEPQEPPIDEVDEFLNGMRPGRSEVRKELEKGSRGNAEMLRRLVGANEAMEGQIADLTHDVKTARRKLRPVRKPVIQNAIGIDIAGERASHENDLQKIEQERSAEMEKTPVTENAIAVARKQGEALAKQAGMIESEKAKKRDPELLARLAKMTPEQKQTQAASVRFENRRLKREIARVDFMIYGKAGKYQKWKQIP
jgi:hypothetical protein